MEDIKVVDLLPFFNVKLMATKENQQVCRNSFFDCGMRNQEWHMYDSNSLPESNETLLIEGIPFAFPDKSVDHCDAISCEGQMIEVSPAFYKSLYLFGAAFDQCGGTEVLTIHYKSGRKEQVKFYIKEWYFLNGNTIWENDDAEVCNTCVPAVYGIHLSDFSKRCIYMTPVSLPQREEIVAIELPFNLDIYICGITLEL